MIITPEMVSRALLAPVPLPDDEDNDMVEAEVRDFIMPGIHRCNNTEAIMRAALTAALAHVP